MLKVARTCGVKNILAFLLIYLPIQALAEGRVYLMTNSVSKNVTSLHMDVTSSESDSATSIDECALVSNFIAFDLEMVPGFPQSFQFRIFCSTYHTFMQVFKTH